MGHGRGHGLGCTHGGRGETGSIQVEAGANRGKAQSMMNSYEIKERMQRHTKDYKILQRFQIRNIP